MARGLEPNPNNQEPLEHLLRRGFVFRNHGWHIINRRFAKFVLTAESPKDWENWLSEAKESHWRYLRIPLFAVIITIIAILVYSATDALETSIGILGGILGLIPLAVRNFSMLRGSGGS